MTPTALTIAGSDPSGGAGLQADLKTFHQHGVYGMSVVTLLTVQNTQTVDDVTVLSAEYVLRQLDAVLVDIPPRAAKTGALGSRAIIEAVAGRAASFDFPLVVDPVMISKHGQPLIDEDAVAVLRSELLPRAAVVTPNVHEASALSGIEITDVASMEKAAAAIADLGPAHVVIKGGHAIADATDVLFADGHITRYPSERIDTRNTHGTGCAYAAAITARLARDDDVPAAVAGAKAFITRAIRTNPHLGGGYGPVNLQAEV